LTAAIAGTLIAAIAGILIAAALISAALISAAVEVGLMGGDEHLSKTLSYQCFFKAF
jgi:hypothetical protein